MPAIKIKGDVIGAGIDYAKFVRNISDKDRERIRNNTDKETFFYIKQKKKNQHYTQTGYKIVSHNSDRYEYYHREPNLKQLIAILRKEKQIK